MVEGTGVVLAEADGAEEDLAGEAAAGVAEEAQEEDFKRRKNE